MITNKSFQFEAYPLFNMQLNETNLPMSLNFFNSNQKNYHNSARSHIQRNWRDFIVSEIQGTLTS